jgi:hypothetical protein
MSNSTISDYMAAVDGIPGWFQPVDILLFEKINQLQEQRGVRGNLLEIGVYQGKSAILLGYFLRDGEQLVALDLFETPAPTDDNRTENQRRFEGLTRRVFEENYRCFHNDMPMILTCSSTEIGNHNLSRSFRFIHIDGSHLYDIVRVDIGTAKALLIHGGVVVFDDYRSSNTPGVAAAVWQEVAKGDLVPFCVTYQKMYATREANRLDLLAEVRTWANEHSALWVRSHMVFGRELLHISMVSKPSLVRRLVRSALPPRFVILGRRLRRRMNQLHERNDR